MFQSYGINIMYCRSLSPLDLFCTGDLEVEKTTLQSSSSHMSRYTTLNHQVTIDNHTYQGLQETVSHDSIDSVTYPSPSSVDVDSDVATDSTEPGLVIDTDCFDLTTPKACNQDNDSSSSSEKNEHFHFFPKSLNADTHCMKEDPAIIDTVCESNCDVLPREGNFLHPAQFNDSSSDHSLSALKVECVTQLDMPSSSTDCLNMPIDVHSLSSVEQFMRITLDEHYRLHHINTHQYRRILERAMSKVKAGKSTTYERVKKLISDFVDVYRIAMS